MTLKAVKTKTNLREEPSLTIHTGNGRALKLGRKTSIVVSLALLVLTFFSSADYREAAYQRREKELSLQQMERRQELTQFAQWMSEKEKDLDRFLLVTGENQQANLIDPPNNKDISSIYDSVRKSIERLENRIRIASDFQLRDEDYFWNVPSIAPVALQDDFVLATGPLNKRGVKGLSGISSFQGMRMHPIDGKEEMHYGIDIFCPVGTNVKATANGTVEFVGHFNPNQDNIRHSFGNFMTIRHGDTGIETMYAHLSNVNVAKGQLVKRGDIIAATGNSGSSTGPHLHYEIIRNGVRVNPLNYITDVPLIDGGKKVFYVKNHLKTSSKKSRRKA